jgi:hypothetical protein
VLLLQEMQEDVAEFDALTLNYLLIDGIAAQALGIGLFWLIQKRWLLRTKTMLLFVRAYRAG